jgi:nitrite reductase (NADH) large subunit
MNPSHVIVIGNGMVGHRFVERLCAAAGAAVQVTVLAEEPRPAYDRVQLSGFFTGKSAQDLSLVADGQYEALGAVLRLNCRVSAIDTAARTVTTADGETLAYDRLVLATGSYPFVPPIEGRDRPGCFVYRTIEDLEAMQAAGRTGRVGTVVGGGLLGLEAAKALKDMGLETHVVEFAPRLMAVQVDDAGGALLRRKIESLGVVVHTATQTLSIGDGETARHAMHFAGGDTLETDLIVFSAGIRPRDELARAAGLAVGERGGITIDAQCRTSDPHVVAVGECAAHEGRCYGLVAPGYEMARVAAVHLAAELAPTRQPQPHAAFVGADMSTKLKLLGVDVASIGDAHATTAGARTLAFHDERSGSYKKLVMDADGKRLLGAVLVGDANDYGDWLALMQNGLPLPERPETLLLGAGESETAGSASGVAALPDSAQICSCNDVSKGAICAAVAGGSVTLAQIKSGTKAGTSCGGCVPLVTKVLNAELAKSGVEVKNHLCEHFPLSRQELFHQVRVGQLRSFETVLAAHGRGAGCDICKPTVASILASCWNDFVLQPDLAPLQDSNDYFLGNIQRDGTYSVVPRIAGGEITPDGLIALGAVAKKYGLYTKITGGQRVDLFGAQVHELPQIWEELIAAGFETGHAYGKSVRTVKSCVGSTWCRYGVDDSVGLAIRLEHRYKGLRSPHKLKFAVSGCTRECAEAQSKDVGVIATERGWNLYVCGNGGMKPRHAELLAADLDEATLIRIIDRFLMFYVRTADRLQRTSTWRDGLEGGLDYLKGVVLDDSLGLAAELEAQMTHVIDAYQCEWKTAVETPAVRRRFQTFINGDGGDPDLHYVAERGQKRPAYPEERASLKGITVAVEA